MENKPIKRTIWGLTWRLFLIIFGLFMCGVLLKGLFLFNNDIKEFNKGAVLTKGIVTEINYRRMPGAEERYYSDPVVLFFTENGDSVVFIDKSALD